MLKSLLRGFNHKQNASVISNEFYQRANHNKFLEDFWNAQHPNSKKLANFFMFQSISIHAIRSDRRQETVSVPLNSLQ